MEFGREVTSGPDVNDWKGAQETYTLKETDGKTLLSVDMDTTEEAFLFYKKVFENRLLKDVLINGGYMLVAFTIMGAILGAWK